jgi:ATP-dependent RNA helicase DDX19/DBP5
MVAEGHTVASLTGGVEGSQRDKTIDEFREGKAKVLITTNVLARGIDVSTVSMVVNYVCSFCFFFSSSWFVWVSRRIYC